MGVTVYVWDMKISEGEVGHAAMKLSDGTYISWWPTKAMGDKVGKSIHKNASSVGITNTFESDIASENGKLHTYEITIDFDEAAIRAWWTSFTQANEKWDVYKMNCSTAVYIALIKGCRPEHGRLEDMLQDSDALFLWRPADIKRLAKRLMRINLAQLNAVLDEAQSEVQSNNRQGGASKE